MADLSKHHYVILTQGQTHPTSAKMASGILRYAPERVAALLDDENAGRDASECMMGLGKGVPIIARLLDGRSLGANALLLGITPAGGLLPTDWREIILEAIDLRWDIVSGLHTFLNDDQEFVDAAERTNVSLVDLRLPPKDLTVNKCRAPQIASFRVHTVGTDCNCGKKVAAVEIDRTLRQMGKKSVFIATGQTGILISGKGIALDRVVSDFVSGAAERLVLENTEYDYQVIEGQGALVHPLYSGVTLSMLHGFAPHALILCHQPDRKIMRGSPSTPVPTPEEMIELYEKMARPVFPSKVVGVALNLMAYNDEEATQQIKKTEKALRLPVTDVIRFGAKKLVKALLEYEKNRVNQ